MNSWLNSLLNEQPPSLRTSGPVTLPSSCTDITQARGSNALTSKGDLWKTLQFKCKEGNANFRLVSLQDEHTLVFSSVLDPLSFSFPKSPKKISNTKCKYVPSTFLQRIHLSSFILLNVKDSMLLICWSSWKENCQETVSPRFTTAQRLRVKDQTHPRNTTDGCVASMCPSRPTRNTHSASQPDWV